MSGRAFCAGSLAGKRSTTACSFQAARSFLDSLSAPWFAVPGNHDIPERNLWRRFFDPANESYQIKNELRDWVVFAPRK